MSDNFLNIFKKIIREANYDNTYKMAWAKALVELSNEYNHNYEVVEIDLKAIAYKVFKYYWNQTIFFNLIQGSNLVKKPIIVQLVEEMINAYYIAINKKQPELFDKAESKFASLNLINLYDKLIKSTVKTLKADVSYRFLILDRVSYNEIYVYQKGDKSLKVKGENLKILLGNQQDLYDLINYRWSLILETFNSSPRINKKVRIMDEREIKREPLNKFRKFLDLENPQKYCFICNKEIIDKDLSIDHVIPWSYLYSDDIWNLVYVHKGCNSRKSDIVPSKEIIEKLINRNNKLVINLSGTNGKIYDELKLAIDKDFVTKFWQGCRS